MKIEKTLNEKISLRKRLALLLLALVVMTASIVGLRPFATEAKAETGTYPTEESKTYYYVSFQSQSADRHYAELGFALPFSLHFGNALTNSETKEEVASWDETISSAEMEKAGDMAYLTKEGYALYQRNTTQHLEPSVYLYAKLSATAENEDYYLGYSSIGQKTLRRNGEDLSCYTLTYPIMKLNRNVVKVRVNYEGELSEETKAQIKANVLAANPNMPMNRVVSVSNEKLTISNVGRDDALTFNIEDLITRVAEIGTQTETPETGEAGTQTAETETTETGTQTEGTDTEETGTQTEGTGTEEGGTQTEDVGTTETGTQTETTETEEAGTQTEGVDTEEAGTQTEGAGTEPTFDQTKINELTEERDALQKTVDDLQKELQDKENASTEQQTKLDELSQKLDALQKTVEEAQKACATKPDSTEKEQLTDALSTLSQSIDKLEQRVGSLSEEKGQTPQGTVSGSTQTTEAPTSPVPSSNAGGTSSSIQLSSAISEALNKATGSTSSSTTTLPNTSDSSGAVTSDGNATPNSEQEAVIRYPNKLTPKAPANATGDNTATGEEAPVTTKGVASAPSKARATVTENVDNGNKDYPIHHGDETDAENSNVSGLTDMYSADARQFVTFTTKTGKTFHLIINHDEQSENVLLLTEVDEDDLLNMVEKKEEPKVVKEEPVKVVEETQPLKTEEPKKEGGLGTILLIILVVGGVAGAGYYFKVVKAKEKKDLESLEEPDDYFSEAEESEDFDEGTEEADKKDELL